MRIPLYLVFALVWSGCAATAVDDVSSVALTRAERTGFSETSSYDDVISFLSAMDAASDDIHITSFGETVEGRNLPLVIWGADNATPEAVATENKTRVFVFANIHAGEVCGKEALQMLIRDLAEGRNRAWADSLVLLLAPIYNADGNERFALDNRPLQNGPVGGMGQRPNAQGLDLNRDFMKLAAPESLALVWLLRTYDPHVIVDLHTTNGTTHAYHLTYAPPLNPNTPEAIDRELRGRLLPSVTESVRQEEGYYMYHYGNIPGAFGEETSAPRAWYTFDARPRFGTNYAGLRNRLGILSEAYSYATFEERIAATKRFVEEVLDYANAHASHIRSITGEADATSIVGRTLSLRATWKASSEPTEILLGEVDTLAHPQTGEMMLQRRDAVHPEEMDAYISFESVEEERAPAAYLIPQSHTEVISLLDAHGVEYYRANQPTPVEIFTIDSMRVAERSFQQRNATTLFGYYATLDDAEPRPMVVVPVNQPLGRLVFMLLEPRSDDGIVAWSVLPRSVYTSHNEYPIRRIHGSLPPR